MALSNVGRRWPLLLSVTGLVGLGGAALAQGAGAFDSQVALGRAAYAQNCASCHGEKLVAGQFAPALKGPEFLAHWGGAPLDTLYEDIHTSMPPGNAELCSVSAITSTPRRSACRATPSGVSDPSLNVVCTWKSASTTR